MAVAVAGANILAQPNRELSPRYQGTAFPCYRIIRQKTSCSCLWLSLAIQHVERPASHAERRELDPHLDLLNNLQMARPVCSVCAPFIITRHHTDPQAIRPTFNSPARRITTHSAATVHQKQSSSKSISTTTLRRCTLLILSWSSENRSSSSLATHSRSFETALPGSVDPGLLRLGSNS